MAAIGTGVAMLGATITGAVAQDLTDYPQPYVDANGVYNTDTAIVFGADAATMDVIGAVDIATGIQFAAKTPVQGSEGTITVAGGVTEDIPLGKAIANDTTFSLDWELDDGDIESFMDTELNFQSESYNLHDELIIGEDSPALATSLSSTEDDYESNVFLETKREKIKYFVVFDEAINVSLATSDDPLEFKFLGKTLKIIDVPDLFTDKLTANVGSEFFMDAGDTVTVDGKKVTLVNVGEGGAIVVDVDGVLETISSSSTKTVNGIEIKNDETFYTNEKSERSASLVIGEDAVDTFQNDDEYIGEPENQPDWKWVIANLGAKASTSIANASSDPEGPTIGIYNYFIKNDADDDPAGIGDCYDLPNNYASVCFDSLTVADDDYLELTIEFSDNVDTAESRLATPFASTDANTIYIHTPVEESLVFKTTSWQTSNFSQVNNKKINQVWLQYPAQADGSNETAIFYWDQDATPNMQYAGNVSFNESNKILELNFGNTKSNNVEILTALPPNSATIMHLAVNMSGDSTTELNYGEDVILMNWTIGSSGVISLGAIASEEEASELHWATTTKHLAGGTAAVNYKDIGKKDEDQRTLYGVIIKDTESNGASDKVVLQIPSDQLQGNIVVKGATTTISGGSTTFIPADIDVTTLLDTEVAGSESTYDLILVGGPCANNAVASVAGLGTTCESARADWSPGEGILKMATNGEHVALLVAGYNAQDTRMASKVLKDHEDYDLAGSEMKITGTVNNPVVAVV